MVERVCVCLACGAKVSVAFKDDLDLRDKSCPICGHSNLVRHDGGSYFRALFGGFGGG